jgi:TonB family protein
VRSSRLILAVSVLVGCAEGAAPSLLGQSRGLGTNVDTFDQQIDTAYTKHDVVLLEVAIAEDAVISVSSGSSPMSKAQFVKIASVTDPVVSKFVGAERKVEGVQVERHGDLIETTGMLVIRFPDRTEVRSNYVRLYRRAPDGWQLVSHHGFFVPPFPPGAGSGIGPGAGAGAAPAATPSGAFRLGPGITPPRPVAQPRPAYTAEAMREKIEGSVLVECVVEIDGTVSHPRIMRSVDPLHGLDAQAVKTVLQWQFEPGRRAGQAVAVLVTVELTFTLQPPK